MSVLLGIPVPRVWPLARQGIRLRDANCGGYSRMGEWRKGVVCDRLGVKCYICSENWFYGYKDL